MGSVGIAVEGMKGRAMYRELETRTLWAARANLREAEEREDIAGVIFHLGELEAILSYSSHATIRDAARRAVEGKSSDPNEMEISSVVSLFDHRPGRQ